MTTAVLQGAMTADDTLDEIEQIVTANARFVYRVAYSVLRRHQDAEDATQETFLRVLRHRKELTHVRQLRLWLARIAWRIAVDRLRGRRPEEETATEAAPELPAGGQSAEQILICRETIELLQSAIMGLPPALRDVITLSTVEEMTSAEIAAVLEIPEGSVRNRLFRARQLLREKLAVFLSRNGARE